VSLFQRLRDWWNAHFRCGADCGYRLLFGGLLLYTPLAALISTRTQAAIYVMLEGAAAWVTLGSLAIIGLVICVDVVVNTMPDRPRWVWITKRRDFLYILGAFASTMVPFPLARYGLVEASAIIWYGLVFVSGLHLLFLDIGAKQRGLLDASD